LQPQRPEPAPGQIDTPQHLFALLLTVSPAGVVHLAARGSAPPGEGYRLWTRSVLFQVIGPVKSDTV